ncbi:ATP-binding protein [Paenibacillus sp. SI8]|uniref:ATP-binding protein n=1 Tax=unclassified Paenibacillus TaxID=185978 RepID=UPI003466EFBE
MKNNKLLLILVPALIVLQGWFTFITFDYPFLGINVEKNAQKQWIIKSLDLNPPHVVLGLQTGDVIQSIDGHTPSDYFTVKYFALVEQAEKISILRGGESFEVMTTDKKKDLLPVYCYSFFGEMISFCIAVLLYLNSSKSKSARFLAFLFLMVGVAFMSLGADSRADILARIIVKSIVMALPYVFLHFLILFFKEKGNVQFPHKFLYYFYGIIGLVMLPSIGYVTPWLSYSYYVFYHTFTMLYFLFGSCMVCGFLIYIYYKFRKETSHFSIIIKTIWFAFIMSFLPLALLSFLPEITIHKDIVSPFITGLFTLFFPLTFCYLLISKKLFDIHLILRRVLSTTIISIFPSALLVGMIFLVFQRDFTLEQGMFSFLFSVTIIAFLLYSLEYFMTKLEIILFPRKYYLQAALKKISNTFGSLSSFRELKDMILVDIVNTLQVAGGAVVIQYDNEFEIISEGDIDHNKIEHAITRSIVNENLYSVYEISRHEEYISYVVLASKKTNTHFHQEEVQWLQVILSNLAIRLENVYLIHKLNLKVQELASRLSNELESNNLNWFRKIMFDMQEKERVRIASDLHDTTMQDIFFIQRKLKAFQKEVADLIDTKFLNDIIDHLNIINTLLRQSCFELNPPTLETAGLLKTIANWIEMERRMCSFELSFITDGDPCIENKELDTKRHLFRVVQELINNAKKHSHASKATISCTSSDAQFYLEYQDNGIGFDLLSTAEQQDQTSGVGIGQMQSRILSIMGSIDIQSSRGQGLKVEIMIPLQRRERSA